MKKLNIYLTLLLLFIALPSYAQKAKTIQEIANTKGVTSVVVSEAMLRLISSDSDVLHAVGDMDLKDVMTKLKTIYVLDSDKKSVVKELRKELDNYIRTFNAEVLVSTKDDGDETHIYYIAPNKLEKNAQLVIYNVDSTDISFICLLGTFNLEDLKGVIGKN